MICKKCGKPITRSYAGMCQGCYKYFLGGGKVYNLPEPGTVARDESGKVICHICGRSYTRLGSHIKESHGMTTAEYKEHYGLCNSTKTTEAAYSTHMQELAYIHGMDKRLLKAGMSTRIKKGETDKRKNKPVRLQEAKDRRDRMRKGRMV